MEDICFCCKKNIEVFSVNLTNGCLCIECYEKAKAHNSRITRRNIGMYSGEEILNIIKVSPSTIANKSTDEDIDKQLSEFLEDSEKEKESVPKNVETVQETKGSPFGIIKTIGWTMLAIVLIICVINPSFLKEISIKALNKSNDVYVEMVKSLKPYDNTSYFEAFDSEFDNNVWSYFKSNEKHIVQVVSTYNDINDKMITQFLLTPQGNDQFYVEPYAVNVSGVNLSNIERNMVIAALFKGDLSQVLLESLLYEN